MVKIRYIRSWEALYHKTHSDCRLDWVATNDISWGDTTYIWWRQLPLCPGSMEVLSDTIGSWLTDWVTGVSIVQGIFIFNVVMYKPLTYGDTYVYPGWSKAIGWLILFSSLLCIPVVAVIKLVRAEGTFRQVGLGTFYLVNAYRP